MIGISMLYITDKWKGVKQGLVPCLVTGVVIGIISFITSKFDNLVVLTGVLYRIGVIIAMFLYLKVTGKKIIDKSILTKEELEYEKQYPLIKALMPWILLIGFILVINVPKSLFNQFYRVWLFPINGLTADGSPIMTRFLWNAYTWIFISTLIAAFLLRPTKTQLKDTMRIWIKRAPRPVFSAAVFFAIGEVMNMSGYSMKAKASVTDSMIKVLADYSAKFFHSVYGAVVTFIGLYSVPFVKTRNRRI